VPKGWPIENKTPAEAAEIEAWEEAGVRAAIDKVEQELGRNGRLLLRPSGTEPLVRVMVEGKDADQVERLCRHLAEAVETAIA
jgi:phosphoglucosamine mutase